MVQRIAEDFFGILALAGIDEQGDKLTITVNHPTTGNTQVEVTNTAANKRTVKEGWKFSSTSMSSTPNTAQLRRQYVCVLRAVVNDFAFTTSDYYFSQYFARSRVPSQ